MVTSSRRTAFSRSTSRGLSLGVATCVSRLAAGRVSGMIEEVYVDALPVPLWYPTRPDVSLLPGNGKLDPARCVCAGQRTVRGHSPRRHRFGPRDDARLPVSVGWDLAPADGNGGRLRRGGGSGVRATPRRGLLVLSSYGATKSPA